MRSGLGERFGRAAAASVLASAFLLFALQPMIARMLLPRYGGSAAVWTTCLLFFQGALLVGYLAAHALGRIPPRPRAALHALLVAAPLLALPISVGAAAAMPAGSPIAGLLALLAAAAGPATLSLAANSTLVQRLYATHLEGDPYPLYAASNLGSVAALLAWPLLLEPWLGLRTQTILWSVGYLGFAALSAALLAVARPSVTARTLAPTASDPAAARATTSATAAGWAFRAAVPSFLLGAVTLELTTDVAASPLLWMLPLAIYLGTWVLAFLPRARVPRRPLALAATVLIAFGLGLTPTAAHHTLALAFGAPLLTLLVGAWLCHSDLARRQPPPARLGAYYAWIAVGGFAGSLGCNLLAPLCFDSVAERPISLFLVALAAALDGEPALDPARARAHPRAFLGPLAYVLVLGAWALRTRGDPASAPLWNLAPIVILVAGLVQSRRPAQFVFASGLVALATVTGLYTSGRVRAQRRSFYGVHRVLEAGGSRLLLHGTTVHGLGRLTPAGHVLPAPTGYYHPNAPLSRALATAGDQSRIAVVGLGTGSLAALARAGQRLDFYELDPLVEELARAWFPFLANSPARVEVVIGDARLRLAEAPRAAYQRIFLDAFSSDAVPIHLLTAEALAGYLDQLAPDGVLIAHVTNRHVDLVPVLRAHARRFGLVAATRRYLPPDGEAKRGYTESRAVALARDPAALATLGAGWLPLPPGSELDWTDDRASLLPALVLRHDGRWPR